MTKLNTKLKNFSIRLALLLASSLSYAVVFLGAHTHNTYAATASIAISGNANIIYNHPVPTGTNFFKSLNISVKTDSPTGYNLYLSSDKEETGLVSLDASNPYRIESVSGYNNSIETDMENSYGYNTEKIDNKLYHAIPGLNSPVNIRAVEEEIEEDFNFNLGFRFNDKIPAGQYQRKLVFTMMVLDQARSTIVSGREFNAALKKSLTVTDPSYFADLTKTTPAVNEHWPDLAIDIGRKKCSDEITEARTVKISTPDSDTPIYLGSFSQGGEEWNKVCIWTRASEINFNEDLSYMFAGLGGTSYTLKFVPQDGITDSMLKFDKVKNLAHFLHNTEAYHRNRIDVTNFLYNLRDNDVENIESIFEDSDVTSVGDMSFAKHAKHIARAFKNTPYLTDANVSYWEISDATDLTSVFENTGISNIDLAGSDFKNATLTTNMFKNSKASYIYLNKAKFDKVTNAAHMFDGANWVSSLDLAHTNFREVTDITSMFNNCTASVFDLKNSKFEKIKDFSNMFNNTSGASKIDLSALQLTAAEDLSNMFKNTTASEIIINTNNNIGGSHITNMSEMFNGAQNVTSLNLGNITTGELTSIKYMFRDNSRLTSLTLPRVFNTSQVEDFSWLFAYTINLEEIGNISQLNTISARDMNHMLYDTRAKVSQIVAILKTNHVTDLSYMLSESSIDGDIIFSSDFHTGEVTNMEGMFAQATYYTADISHFDFSSVENMSKMFMGGTTEVSYGACPHGLGMSDVIWPANTQTTPVKTMAYLFTSNCNIKKIKAPKIIAPNLKDTRYAFAGLKEVTSIDLDNFDTSSVENMEGMFSFNDTDFMKDQHIKISLNTSNVKNMSKLFHYVYVSYLDVSDFDVSKVTNFSNTFGYTWLYELDLTGWNTISATDMTSMFEDSNWLQKIYASDSFVTTNVVASDNIFYSLPEAHYRGGAGSYIQNNIRYAHIDGGTANPGAFWRK